MKQHTTTTALRSIIATDERMGNTTAADLTRTALAIHERILTHGFDATAQAGYSALLDAAAAARAEQHASRTAATSDERVADMMVSFAIAAAEAA